MHAAVNVRSPASHMLPSGSGRASVCQAGMPWCRVAAGSPSCPAVGVVWSQVFEACVAGSHARPSWTWSAGCSVPWSCPWQDAMAEPYRALGEPRSHWASPCLRPVPWQTGRDARGLELSAPSLPAPQASRSRRQASCSLSNPPGQPECPLPSRSQVWGPGWPVPVSLGDQAGSLHHLCIPGTQLLRPQRC